MQKIRGILVIFFLCVVYVLFTLVNTHAPTKDQTPSASVENEANKAAAKCQDSNRYSVQCYGEFLSQVTHTHDVFFAQAVLAKLWEIDEQTRSCHVLAHKSALSEIEKNPRGWKELLEKINPQVCSGGFFHGILEGHARFDQSFSLTEKEIDAVCRNADAYKEGSCVHIMGHLLLLEFDADITNALEVCDRITIASDECYRGVFMENMTKQNLVEHGFAEQVNWTKELANTYEALCTRFAGKAANGCWEQMGHMYAAVEDDDAQTVYRQCQKANKPTYAQNCYLHAVQKIAVTGDPQEKIYSLCNPFLSKKSVYNECLARVINTLLTTSQSFSQRARSFCEHLKEEQNTCFNLLEKK